MAGTPPDRAHWGRVARDWIAWARAPGHDAFWAYRQAFADFVGRGSGTALEIGCGEGRVARELCGLGWRVVASDAVEAMVAAAVACRSADGYTVAEAKQLPFRSGSFDLVVAYNVLMDVEEMPAAVQEAARVLRPGGRLILSLVHPFADRGAFAGPEQDAPFVLSGSYFGRERFEDTVSRAGLSMAFAGWSRPLETYVDALQNAGMAIAALREPVPDQPVREELLQWIRVPLFLWLETVPLSGGASAAG